MEGHVEMYHEMLNYQSISWSLDRDDDLNRHIRLDKMVFVTIMRMIEGFIRRILLLMD